MSLFIFLAINRVCMWFCKTASIASVPVVLLDVSDMLAGDGVVIWRCVIVFSVNPIFHAEWRLASAADL